MKVKIIYLTLVMISVLACGCSRNDNTDSGQSNVSDSDQSSVPESSNTTQSTENGTENGVGTDNTTVQENHTETHSNTNGTETMITEDDAKSIALEHAGLSESQVTYIKIGIDREDGRDVYDVEFYTDNEKEYDYEIDPYTGQILDFDYDADYLD